ncbi:MAG: LTA synthase family protein [Bdellovibrio sp.]|jgi:phosphoglycerol transferase MdoB-like AlkP superfamily enzyme
MLLSGLFFFTLVLYSLIRGVFLIWNHALYQSVSSTDLFLSFVYGLRFDSSVIAMLSIPAFLLLALGLFAQKDVRRLSAWVFVSMQIPFLILNMGEVEWVQFTGRRFTVQSFSMAAQIEGKFWATILPYVPLLLVSTVLMALYLVACWWWTGRQGKKPARFSRGPKIAIGFVALIFLVITARGGLQKKPIGFAHAQVFASPVLNQLAQNSSFSLIHSLRRVGLPRENFMSQEQMMALMNGSLPGQTLIAPVRFEKPQNVVVVILESFTLDHLGLPHGDQGFTPFLDDLSKRGLLFTNAFANARRSIEGIGALLGGIPALMTEPFISSQYASNTFYGWGTILGSLGYSSAFYHGGDNGTMYFDQFMKSAGVQAYYGASEYPNKADHDGTWGIWDEPFLLNMAGRLREMPEPFAATVLTLTSHNPFKVPITARGVYPKGTNEIHEVIGYTDGALKKFFEAAAKEPWFDNTLFVITADHTYKPVRPRYQNELGQYRVPLLFFHPRVSKWPDVDTRAPVQHIDLIPSVLDFLGEDFAHTNLLGRSVFRSGERYVVLQSEGFYSLVTKSHRLTMDAQGEAHLYDLEDHLSPAAPEPPKELDQPEIRQSLLQKLKATRQYFSEGLWDNKLYFPAGR